MERDEVQRRLGIARIVALITLLCALCALAGVLAQRQDSIAFNTAQLVSAPPMERAV